MPVHRAEAVHVSNNRSSWHSTVTRDTALRLYAFQSFKLLVFNIVQAARGGGAPGLPNRKARKRTPSLRLMIRPPGASHNFSEQPGDRET